METCTIADIGIDIGGTDAPPLIAATNEYLATFARPMKTDGDGFLLGRLECLHCGATLDGAMGSFQWGLASGEGQCSRCGWPARAHHCPRDANGETIFTGPVEFILQYHPDHVTTNDPEVAAETTQK